MIMFLIIKKGKLMKKIIYILILIFSISSSPKAQAGEHIGDKLLIGALTLAIGSLVSIQIKANFQKYKEEFPNATLKDFLEKNPEKASVIEDQLRYLMSNTKNEKSYIRYQKLADKIGMSDIPPFMPEDTINYKPDGLSTHIENVPENLENPVNKIHFPYILENPETKERIDTRLEFPMETPKNWEEYILLKKSDSQILGENMIKAGQVKPSHSANHHIIPKTMKDAQSARDILEKYGDIKVNDAENGVFLPQKGLDGKGNVSAAIGLIHSGVHPKVYAIWVNKEILSVPVDLNNKEQSRINLINKLNEIKNKLIDAQKNGKTWHNIMN